MLSSLIDEVMAQPFYPTDDDVGFDSNSKQDALSIPHTIQSDNHLDIVDRGLSCINTGAEVEAKGRGPTRRRIPVAVNSSMLQTKVQVSTGSGWPYPANDMASLRSGTYAPSVTSSKLGGLPTNLPNHLIRPFSRAPDHEVAPDTHNPYGRQTSDIESTINYEDDCSTPYHVQSSSAYMLPNSPQVFLPDYCGMVWNSKGWGAALQSSRAAAEMMFSERDAVSPLAHPAYSYVISGQGPQSSEALSMAPTQGPLTSPIQGTERTLPNPTGRSPFSGNNCDPTTATDWPPSSAHDYKVCNHWASRCEPRTSMPPASNIPFNTATMGRTKLIPSNGQDMTFGFLPVSSSSASSPSLPSSGAFSSLESAACPSEAGDEFRGNADSPYRIFSRDSRRMVSLTDYRSNNTYGYSRPAYRNRSEAGDSNSESTLINGLPYTRPTHSVSLPQIDEKPGLQAVARHSSCTGLCSP